MQSRCAVQFGNDRKKLILTGQDNETLEHLALKLAGFVLFFGWDPVVEISPKHPALNGQEFRPDLAAFNSAGEIFLWIECGNVTTHKLDKIIRDQAVEQGLPISVRDHLLVTLRDWKTDDEEWREIQQVL